MRSLEASALRSCATSCSRCRAASCSRCSAASCSRCCRTCHHESCMQFLRTASSYSTWMPAIVGFVKSHKWSQVSLLFLRALTFESTVTELSRQLFLSKLSVLLSMSFDEEDALLSDKLRAIKELRSSKVGGVCAGVDVLEDRSFCESQRNDPWLGMDWT